MKLILQIFSISLFTILFISCDDASNSSDSFKYGAINKEYVIITDVETLQNSGDEISIYIDSIFSGLINSEIISTGLKSFDLNDDNQADIRFEIIDLNTFNSGQLPAYLDSMAARVHPVTIQILDNSTYGYPDALQMNDEIIKEGHWSSNISVLGTFMNAGQFQGKGERFLGFRLPIEENYHYGWIRIYCSEHNDTLRILDYAYNELADKLIFAGQKE